MIKQEQINDASYDYDRIMSQPLEGLIEQELVTTYRKDGKIFQHSVQRRFFDNDYVDSTTSKFIG